MEHEQIPSREKVFNVEFLKAEIAASTAADAAFFAAYPGRSHLIRKATAAEVHLTRLAGDMPPEPMPGWEEIILIRVIRAEGDARQHVVIEALKLDFAAMGEDEIAEMFWGICCGSSVEAGLLS